MESDFHSNSSSSLEDSWDSADENEFSESICFKKKILQLPQCFCSEEDIFKEVLNYATWRNILNSKNRTRLEEFLPAFPENDDKEKGETLRKLISGDNFKFGNPVKEFFQKLKDGFFSLDIVEVTDDLIKTNYREYKNQLRLYSYHLFEDILFARKKLINATYNLPPGQAVKMLQFHAKPKDAILHERTRLRYFSTLQEIKDEVFELDTCSEDENYPESNVPKVFKKYKKQLQIQESSFLSEISKICATTSYPPGHSGYGNIFNHCTEMLEVSEERYREMLNNHKDRITQNPIHPKLITSKLNLKDVTVRSNMGKRLQNKDVYPRKKTKNSENVVSSINPTLITVSHETEPISKAIKREESSYPCNIPDSALEVPSYIQETEVQTDSLTIVEEGENSHSDSDVLHQNSRHPSPYPEVNRYPTCFFALLRNLFCESAEKKLSAIKLEEKVRLWQNGPTASLFEWQTYHESWSDLVSPALKFLAGDFINELPDSFVPFLDYKEKQQQWQWIGSGRDSEEQLVVLCQQWLDTKDDISADILETYQGSPPPPRITTEWIVRPTADEEKKIYQEQECFRYENPHRAFTFKIHGYEAVVGPVKGVYGKENSINKAREHSLLTSDRPPFVTILSLVRDSAARLPNGEGTRADICELLKDSQYLAPANDQQIHTVVSGALDRLHYEKDPCVKYDVNRKLWIYLHRHRTEEEFERIHQAQAAAAKAKKAVQKGKFPKLKSKDISGAAIYNTQSDAGSIFNMDVKTPGFGSTINYLVPKGASVQCLQGNTKIPVSGFLIHNNASSNNPEVKTEVIKVENQYNPNEADKEDMSATRENHFTSFTSNLKQEIIMPQTSFDTNVKAISNEYNAVNISKASVSCSKTTLGSTKSTVSNVTYTVSIPKTTDTNVKSSFSNMKSNQIISVTPVNIKKIKTKCGLSPNAMSMNSPDMKPPSPSFVGQPTILHPLLNPTNMELSNLNVNATSSPSLMSTSKMTCQNMSSLPSRVTGFQTIVIKQEPGLRSCAGVSGVPLLSVEENVSSTDSTAISSAPIVARFVHGSQYFSLCNIAENSTTCSSTKPITASVQNFRVQAGNICHQVLSTSEIKVVNSTPVSAVSETSIPVLALKQQLLPGKESTSHTHSPTALNVCGRFYQMANLRGVKSKNVSNIKADLSSKDATYTLDKDSNVAIFPLHMYESTVSNTVAASQTDMKGNLR